MIKKILLSLLLIISITTFAQKNINQYKYVIVPNKFEFVKKIDGYQTSSLTKFLFKKYGFNAYLSNEDIPKDAVLDNCLSLRANVKDESGMFSTKSIVQLKDCYGNVVFTSKQGSSKKKEYKKAYHEAIRKAFLSVKRLNYKYDESINLNTNKESKLVNDIANNEPKKTAQKITKLKTNTSKTTLLYAKPNTNGFQLLNSKSIVIMEVLKTNKQNVFILKNKKGILYKNNNQWFAEFYENNKKVIEKKNIQF